MISFDQLEPKLLVWWTSYHGFNSTSYPVVILDFDQEKLTVFTLGDFKPLTLSLIVPDDEDSPLLDMRVCSAEEVRRYLQNRLAESQKILAKQAAAHYNLTENIKNFFKLYLPDEHDHQNEL